MVSVVPRSLKNGNDLGKHIEIINFAVWNRRTIQTVKINMVMIGLIFIISYHTGMKTKRATV